MKSIEGESFGTDEYHSVEYGKLHRNKIIQKIKDKFGPTPVRLTGGKRAWRFDIVKLQRIAVSYSTDIKIETTLKKSGVSDSNDSSDSTLGTPLHTKHEEIQSENDKNEVPTLTREPSQPSQPSLPDSSRTFSYKCYHNGCICGHKCDFKTNDVNEYERHGALYNIENPLLYPSSYEMKKYGLTPQGKEWEV